jgi:hypothetical protein
MQIRPVGAKLFQADVQTDIYDEAGSRFSRKIAFCTTGIKPNRCKEDHLATHVLLRLTEHISCVSERNEVSHAFFLDDGWVFSEVCITGIISNVFCMKAGPSAQRVLTVYRTVQICGRAV